MAWPPLGSIGNDCASHCGKENSGTAVVKTVVVYQGFLSVVKGAFFYAEFLHGELDMVLIVNDLIDPQQSYHLLRQHCAGSVLLHYAVVKADGGTGRTSCAVDYCLEPGAEKELRQIADHLKTRWSLDGVLLQRRQGRLGVGEIISLVAVSAAASVDAFSACRQGLDLIKRMQTVSKREVFV